MGNTESRDGQWSAQGEAGHAAQPDEGMGNAERARWSTTNGNNAGMGDQECQEKSGESQSGNASQALDRAGEWQTESTLGRSITRTSDWLDNAELCITCDNRTDELRLLGNGVVPATAELAFRTLLDELLTTMSH